MCIYNYIIYIYTCIHVRVCVVYMCIYILYACIHMYPIHLHKHMGFDGHSSQCLCWKTRKDYVAHSLLCNRDSMPVRICGPPSIGSYWSSFCCKCSKNSKGKKFKLSHHHGTCLRLQRACALNQGVVTVRVVVYLWPLAAPSPTHSWSCEIGRNGNLKRKPVWCPIYGSLLLFLKQLIKIWFWMDLNGFSSQEFCMLNQPADSL